MADDPYPSGWETTAVLGDGATIELRPIRPADRELLRRFHNRQSPESVYLRFFGPRPRLSERDLDYFTIIDYRLRMAFVAVLGGELVGVARYETLSDRNVAEIAFFVDDEHHGRGLATLMLEFLAAAGRRQGLDGFSASVLPENYGMLRVFRTAGFAVDTGFEDGAIAVTLGIDVTDEATAAIEARERRAQAQSIARLLEPQSIAVIGASRRADSVGNMLLRHLLSAPFAGSVQVVNRSGEPVAGLSSVTSVSDLDRPVDLAVVVAAAEEVQNIAEACAALGVGGLVVISAGFAEVGSDGAERERELVDAVRRNGLRLIGPNAFGVANSDPEVNLRALFVPVEVREGPVGLLSQSGPLGAALLAEFDRTDVGVSSFAAVGNRADVSVNDLLQYWAADGRTSAIALYLENVGNVTKFTRLARSISMIKPIITVAPAEQELRQLFSQSGVIMVSEVAELAEQASLAIRQPVPRGSRVAVVSNASSVARLATAACLAEGLDLVAPSLVGDADNLLVDQQADAADYERLAVQAAVSAEVDVVLLAFVPTSKLPLRQLTELLARLNRAVDKPMVATGLAGLVASDVPELPVFAFPERAAKALGRWVRLGNWRRREPGPDIAMANEREISSTIAGYLGTTETAAAKTAFTLSRSEAENLLTVIGVDHAPTASAWTLAEARESATALGFPLAMKAGGLADRLAGEAGGTALDLQDHEQLGAAFERMSDRLPDFLPALLQPMVPTGPHLRIELLQDAGTGARLAIGKGGYGSDHLPPEAVHVLPAGALEIAALTDGPWLAALIPDNGCRQALNRLLGNLAGAAGIAPEIHRLVLNPVLLSTNQAMAVEVEIELRKVDQSPLDELRHL